MSLLSEFQDQLTTTGRALDAVTVSVGRDHRGSGVVVAPGRIVTNAHNLRDRTTKVTFADGRTVQASVRGTDTARDLVVLDADTTEVTPIEWADASPGLGDFVVAAARDGSGLRVTVGTVSQESRSFRGPHGRPITVALEHTAPLARGSSGGPLTDLDGHLVAINTHRLGKGFTAAQLATDALHALLEDLGEGRSRCPLVLGVELAPSRVARKLRASVGLPERDGLLVRGVVDGSPADRAGIRSGDLIVAAGGTELSDADALYAVLSAHDASQSLAVVVVRGADEFDVAVEFAADAAAEPGSGPRGLPVISVGRAVTAEDVRSLDDG